MDIVLVAIYLASGQVKSLLAFVTKYNLELCRCSTLVFCSLIVHWQITLVSDTAFSSFFSLSWEEALAVALSSWALILPISSSNFSRSFSKVWAQLLHSGKQGRVWLAKEPTPYIVNCILQSNLRYFFVYSPWHCSSVFVSPGSSVFLQTAETIKKY